MSRLTKKHRTWLEEKFGWKANFQPNERRLYGHDIAAMPSLFKSVVGRTIPDAVVQPESEAELSELVRWAAANRIPLVPRGKGSSGYGGIIPTRKGIVVDFYRMKDVVAVDAAGETVTVEPGITWEQLDREIKKQGLTLRLYPTSYPSSSVGGWLAQGGAGIGSYEFGWFAESVLGVRVVLPSGEVREMEGSDLELVADAEGTTGIISRVTLRVQKLEKLGVIAIACPDAHKLTAVFQEIIGRHLPLWSVVFINPRMAEMKNRAPVRTHHGHPAEHKVILPAAYIAVLAFRESERQKIVPVLPEVLDDCQGEVLSQEIADHEWENRFKLMIVKRLGPSLVPAEVVVPLGTLGAVMEEIENKVNQPVVKEGVLVRAGKEGKPEVVILGFIPSDQRKFSYNFVFGLVLTIMKIAEKYGGRAYSTGLYFTGQVKKILGKERSARLKKFKREVDRHRILNPDKVTGGKLVGPILNIARVFEPLVRPFGNNVITQIGERLTKPVRGIPPDVAWYAYGCSQCGYCVDECDQFYSRGWESQSPRGKWYWLREFMEGRMDWDQQMVDTFLVCTTCELCNLRCSAALPIEPSWMELRGKLVHDDKRMTLESFRGHDRPADPAGFRRLDGYDVAGDAAGNASGYGQDDEGDRQAGPGQGMDVCADEAGVPGALSETPAGDDTQGHADHAGARRRADPDA
jgi:FAD/FMN-containing dehydrogenase